MGPLSCSLSYDCAGDPLKSCFFLCFLTQTQQHCCGSQVLAVPSVSDVWYNDRNKMCTLIEVSVLQEISPTSSEAPQQGLFKPNWSGSLQATSRWFYFSRFVWWPSSFVQVVACASIEMHSPTQLFPACDITFLACHAAIVFRRM